MNRALRTSSIILMVLNGVSASVGGLLFIVDPSGNKLQMPTTWLKHSPFETFLIPGVILFSAIGIFSLLIAFLGVLKSRHYDKLVLLEGIILVGWIIIQVFMLQTVYFLHLILGAVGIILIVLGTLLNHAGNSLVKPV